ncbi:mannose-1-phosphate guanylyltransferase/mannose-6-phosphate isomerase [Sphingomonas piscis]|uniref:mannose-1-phosphate guanylyltransferase n=1 Tax=Sphingomonas piscis TaxID=2714943 RepID=A0A6G7YMT1_9SPHN|nr:mannose-1-phosphate guanylyltransferase/mannose-6-phosphate isomerase [Sphingomonas piscis]QIK78055.1 mannose-1-phosphate guanylyltransferase/mannose-6-phosphate isomerase [Sphingomonas piscis]
MNAGGKQLVRPVILSGGGGTRLWPLSRMGAPKQFLPILNDESLLQSTVKRTTGDMFSDPIVVTGEEQRFFVANQLEEIGLAPAAILLEPAPRNTAPAIALAALCAANLGDELILVLPSDHVIEHVSAFTDAVAAASASALDGHIVTFGIQPTAPTSGYGYIEATQVEPGQAVRKIRRFIEKPDGERAAALMATGNCYWNSGMFLMQPSTFLAELERLAPAIAAPVASSMASPTVDGAFLRPDAAQFTQATSESIDYAVMEATELARVIPVDLGWSDVGSWDAVLEASEAGAGGNVLKGDVHVLDVHNSLIRSEADVTVGVVGLSDIVCVMTGDAALIAPLSRTQDVKKLVDAMRLSGHPRADEPQRVYRPWGTYETVDRGERFQTRRLILKPGAQQSLQRHRQRSEHFVIVAGEAEITIDGKTVHLVENQSAFVPAGVPHRIRNIGAEPLHIVEVQSGPYLGEDDIERLADAYGRD